MHRFFKKLTHQLIHPTSIQAHQRCSFWLGAKVYLGSTQKARARQLDQNSTETIGFKKGRAKMLWNQNMPNEPWKQWNTVTFFFCMQWWTTKTTKEIKRPTRHQRPRWFVNEKYNRTYETISITTKLSSFSKTFLLEALPSNTPTIYDQWLQSTAAMTHRLLLQSTLALRRRNVCAQQNLGIVSGEKSLALERSVDGDVWIEYVARKSETL